MKRGIVLGLIAVIVGVSVGAANAAVILPAGANSLRFEGLAAFTTSFEPTINVATGALVPPLPTDQPLTLTAFGQVNTVLDLANSLNKGTINGQLTFAYTGATLTPISVAASGGGVGDTSVTYTITSNVSGGTISVYDSNSATLNTAGYIGQTFTGVPAQATQGTLFIQASTPADAQSSITISFLRPTPTSNFQSFETRLQQLNGGAFTITGGSILASNPGLLGKALQASQDGVFASNFATEDVTINGQTVTRNVATNKLMEGDFVMDTNAIPEPASVALLALGGLILLSGRRQWRLAA